MKIRDLLKIKSRPVITVGPNETVTGAIQKLVDSDRGSLSVCNDKGELVGIITERDIVRKCVARSVAIASTKVRDVMTEQVAVGIPEDDLGYVISVMKQKRIRHIPIVDNQKVVGMVSMRDLLDMQLDQAEAQIRYASLLPKRTQRRLV